MRKTETVTITSSDRDAGKSFHLVEMPADKFERWCMRALSSAARAGVDVSEVPTGGAAAIAAIGIEAILKVPFAEAEPLMDEMFECVRVIRDPRNPEATTFPLVEGDIEEVATRFHLRMKLFGLHVGFSPGAASSSLKETTAPKSEASPNAQTSLRSSQRPSRIKRRA